MDILNALQSGLITASAEETEQVGSRLAAALPEDAALALSGDLGSGKTTLVRGLARGLGIPASVTSPTYNIYSIYKGRRMLLHMDAYRLSDAHELESLSLEEFLRPPFLIVVEWPEHVPQFFETWTTYWLDLSILPDHRHRISLRPAAQT